MAKTTIDQFPFNSIAYLDQLPPSSTTELAPVLSPGSALDIQSSLLRSELDFLLGYVQPHETFAGFAPPNNMNCPSTFSYKILNGVDVNAVMDSLRTITPSSYNQQEEVILLEQSFEEIGIIERNYEFATNQLLRLQRG